MHGGTHLPIVGNADSCHYLLSVFLRKGVGLGVEVEIGANRKRLSTGAVLALRACPEGKKGGGLG